jgi:hypothetical protein
MRRPKAHKPSWQTTSICSDHSPHLGAQIEEAALATIYEDKAKEMGK